jgi:hypothetical protein
MGQTKDWREFERLVSRIEEAAATHGAVVKSPDRIRDLTTGQLREVDASIRQKIGSAEILVTIECRQRSRIEDDTWIEQLATKRQKIGAARTIAVSSKGFSDSAIKSADQFGIDLRTLTGVNPSDLDSWFLGTGAVHVCRLIENIRCGLVLYDENKIPEATGFWAPDVELNVLYHKDMKSPYAIRDYLPILEITKPKMFKRVPFDGTTVELEFPIKWRYGELSLATTAGRRWVYLTNLFADVSYQSTVCDIQDGRHHEYRSVAGKKIQHTSFDTTFLGIPTTFEHQSDDRGVSVVRRKFRQPSAD